MKVKDYEDYSNKYGAGFNKWKTKFGPPRGMLFESIPMYGQDLDFNGIIDDKIVWVEAKIKGDSSDFCNPQIKKSLLPQFKRLSGPKLFIYCYKSLTLDWESDFNDFGLFEKGTLTIDGDNFHNIKFPVAFIIKKFIELNEDEFLHFITNY